MPPSNRSAILHTCSEFEHEHSGILPVLRSAATSPTRKSTGSRAPCPSEPRAKRARRRGRSRNSHERLAKRRACVRAFSRNSGTNGTAFNHFRHRIGRNRSSAHRTFRKLPHLRSSMRLGDFLRIRRALTPKTKRSDLPCEVHSGRICSVY